MCVSMLSAVNLAIGPWFKNAPRKATTQMGLSEALK